MALIKNSAKVNRAIDFSGLNRSETMSKNSVYATDLDCVMEFSNKHLIMIEMKERGVNMGWGQKYAFSRIADAWDGKNELSNSIVIHVTHDPNIEGDVPISECYLKSIYTKGKWEDMAESINLLDYLHNIAERWDIPKLKKQ